MTGVPLRLQAITLVALACSALAWLALARVDVPMPMDEPLTLGLDIVTFLSVWVAMMLATMLPAIVPMTRAFARAQQGRGGDASIVIFVGAYFLVWTSFGAVAYAVATALEAAAMAFPELTSVAPVAAAATLVLAGAYQLSPFKSICLTGCRSPLGFLLAHWRDGAMGALRMGARHAALCVGCCWLLFVALFPVGMMNLTAMALLAGLILAEKAVPFGDRIGRAAGIALVGYAIGGLMLPALAPGA